MADESDEYSHPRSLAGRSAIVTGATQGAGRGMALALLDRGAVVLLVGLKSEGLAAMAAELMRAGSTFDTLVVDLRDPEM